MKVEDLRLVALVGNSAAGKTTLGLAMLKEAGVIKRLEDNVLDFDPEEKKRGITLTTSLAELEWNKKLVQILDTPGYVDFMADVLGALRVADNAVFVVDASQGAGGLERRWEGVEPGRAKIIFVNKCEGADPKAALEELRELFGTSVQPFNFWHGGEVVSLLASEVPPELGELREGLMESIVEADDALMEKYLEGEEITPEDLKGVLKTALVQGTLTPVLFGEAKEGKGVRELLDFLVNFGLSLADRPREVAEEKGQEVELEPSPDGPLAALVFKTITEAHVGEIYYIRVYSGTLKSGDEVYNSVSGETEKINVVFRVIGHDRKEIPQLVPGQVGALVKLKATKTGDTLTEKGREIRLRWVELPKPLHTIAIKPQTRNDEEKLSEAISRLHAEDPSFVYRYDPELKQHLLSGYGDIHLDVIIAKMQEKFNVKINKEKPKIPYRETIRRKAEAMGKYVKQTGGRGQYGICYIRIEPLPRGQGYEWVDEIFGGAIPKEYRPAVEQGVKKAMQAGVLAGYPVVDVKVTLYDGKYHEVDSSNMAFEIAGSLAFKEAQSKADPYLLEPIYKVTVWVPDENMGDVIGEINARRGRIQGMEPEGRMQKITALVPLAEMLDFTAALRAKTKGRGWFDMEFSHYEEVPPDIAKRVIAQAQAEREAEKK